MATAEELLSKSVVVDKTLVISNDLRTISIPSTVHNLGVATDDEVLVLSFKMPRYITGLDLANGFYIRINYINAAGEGDVYTIRSPKVSEDSIEFKWLVGPTATRYKGETRFNVSLVKLYSDGTVDRRYNTHPTSLKVLEGLDVDDAVVEDYGDVVTDIIAQWQKEVVSADEYLVNKSEELLETCKEEINSIGTTVLNDISLTVDDAVEKWFNENDLYTDVSQFGFKYSDKVYSANISKTTSDSVTLYLFESDGGYAAVVSGKGEMKDYQLDTDKTPFVAREYEDYVSKINAVYVESGVTSIGDYFMYAAHELTNLVFADSSKITRLGKRCFATTNISGDYEFPSLKHYEGTVLIDEPFRVCQNLTGLTVGISDEIYEDGYETGYKNLVVSAGSFSHCYNLKHFRVTDEGNNTHVRLGLATFDCCPKLDLVELHPSRTTPDGQNFLRIPGQAMKVKHRVLKDADNLPPYAATDTGRIRCVSLADLDENEWDLEKDKGVRKAASLSTYRRWKIDKDTNGPCSEAYNAMLGVQSEYIGRKHQLGIPESDYQSQPGYLNYTFYIGNKINPAVQDLELWNAIFWGEFNGDVFRNPYYGSCYLFAYYHAWNVLHPNQQYDTFHDFVTDKLKSATVTLDADAAKNLSSDNWEYRDLIMNLNLNDDYGNPLYSDDYFNKGRTVLIRDLPVCLKNGTGADGEYTQLGVPGEATWGVRKVLGWDAERRTASPSDLASNPLLWANIKRDAIESIFDGMPVLIECVAYAYGTSDLSYQGMHAVTAIGYDGDTDMFLIIDSGAVFEPDIHGPAVYWLPFEALLDPSEESAVWIFSKVDVGATITPISENSVNTRRLSNIETNVSALGVTTDSLSDSVTILGERVDALESSSGDITIPEIDDLTEQIDAISSSVTSLGERVDALESSSGDNTIPEIDDLTEQIDAINTNVGSIESALENIITIQEDVIKSYEEGVADGTQSAYDSFWDNYQLGGDRDQYGRAFDYWSDEIFWPKYNITPTGAYACDYMFSYSTISNIKERLEECGVSLSFSQATRLTYTFDNCKTTEVPELDLQNCDTLRGTFYGCMNLTKLSIINLKPTCTFSAAFVSLNNLTDLSIEGTIGQNGFSIASASKLSRASVQSIITALEDKTGDNSTTWTIALHKNCVTDDDRAAAASKNWQIST